MLDLNQFISFVEQYGSLGYFVVFGVLLLCGFGLPLPEDIVLVTGGVISGLGYTNIIIMLFIGFAGVLVGDGIMFSLGYYFGEKVLEFKIIKFIITNKRRNAIENMFAKYGKIVLFFARFAPGLRTPTFILAGITRKVSYKIFLFTDGFAALISVPVWILLGYYLANNRHYLFDLVQQGEKWVLIALITGVLLFILIAYIKMKKKKEG